MTSIAAKFSLVAANAFIHRIHNPSGRLRNHHITHDALRQNFDAGWINPPFQLRANRYVHGNQAFQIKSWRLRHFRFFPIGIIGDELGSSQSTVRQEQGAGQKTLNHGDARPGRRGGLEIRRADGVPQRLAQGLAHNARSGADQSWRQGAAPAQKSGRGARARRWGCC